VILPNEEDKRRANDVWRSRHTEPEFVTIQRIADMLVQERAATLELKEVKDVVLHCHHDIHCPSRDDTYRGCNCGRDQALDAFYKLKDSYSPSGIKQ
jgi:hypothetical protein